MHRFGFSDQISQQLRTVRFVKLIIQSFYGEGGGLRHLSFSGPRTKQGMFKDEVNPKSNGSVTSSYQGAGAMGRLYREVKRYLMVSATQSEGLSRKLVIGSTGAM